MRRVKYFEFGMEVIGLIKVSNEGLVKNEKAGARTHVLMEAKSRGACLYPEPEAKPNHQSIQIQFSATSTT
jgi:hypothetical protein